MSRPTAPRTDIPTIEGDSETYWQAFKNGELLLVRCNACGYVHHYPRPFCPRCWSEDVQDVPASGRGVLYTYSIVYSNDLAPFKERLPYVAAIVDLDEGPRVMTTVVGVEHDRLRIGMPLVADFVEVTDEIRTVVFRPA